jgi:hypothetical protein
MNKLLIVLAIVVSLGIGASQAIAWYGDGSWGYPGPGWCNWGGGYYPEDRGSYQKFLNETEKSRQELAAKQGEYDALMAQPNPDQQKAGRLAQDITRLQDQLEAKAQTYNHPAPVPRGGYSQTPHTNHGYGCGYMSRSCW